MGIMENTEKMGDAGQILWPEACDSAVIVTLNLDAELFARAYYPEIELFDSELAALGRAGIEVGLGRVLDALSAHEVSATAFVPGWVAQKYPDAVRTLTGRGHEVACRGYAQENLGLLSEADQEEAIRKGMQALTDICGKAPEGFRAPAGEFTERTLSIVKKLGFSYSSSLSDDDVPYFNRLESGGELIEIPIHWPLSDLPYFMFNFWPPIPFGQARISCFDKVLTNWKWEYDGARRDHSCCVLQLDPTTMGDPGRIFMLEELLAYMRENGRPWFTTCARMARFMSEGAR
jgi:peptidoglycan/xylan/chitin deacetylase (PgdA/CDA1 family)